MRPTRLLRATLAALVLLGGQTISPGDTQATADWLWHDYNTVPSIPEPASSTEMWVKVGYQDYVDSARIYYTIDGTSPQGSYGTTTNGSVVSMSFDHVEWDSDAGQYVDWWKGSIPAQTEGTVVRYKIAAWHSGGGDIVFADNNVGTSQTATEFSYLSSDFETPQWAKDAVIYEVFVDRFYDGDPTNNIDYTGTLDGYNGGDLEGIIQKLPHLEELGVTAIWVTPVFEGPAYHGYRISDFEDVEENFGDLAKLEELVDEAHASGINVILDFVANHSSDTHPFFEDASTDCATSPYYEWYIFYDCPPADVDDYASFFGVSTLPKLNNENPDTRDYTIGLAVDLFEDYDIDGLRLDYTLGLGHNYWVDFRNAVKAVNPDAFLIGEAWDTPEVMRSFEGELDGVLDFSLIFTFRDFFANRLINVDDFDAALDTHEAYYDPEYLNGKFLSNHDINRFLWESGDDEDRLMLAATAQFTLQDPPIIYQGDEIGQSQAQDISQGDKYVRAPMAWGSINQTVLDHYTRVADIRSTYAALRTGDRAALHRHNANGTYAFRREDASDTLIVALNNSDSTRSLTIPNLLGQSLGVANGAVLTDLLGGGTYTVSGGQISVDLEALNGAILVEEKSSDVDVTFSVNGYVTSLGEDMFIVGNTPELGYWDPDRAVPLNWVDSDTWSGTVSFTDLTKGDDIEYKFIVKDGSSVTWEGGSNHTYSVPSTGTDSVSDNWQS